MMFVRSLLISLALALGIAAVSHAQWSPPAMLSTMPTSGGGGGGYTGPGDVVATWTFWAGLRAFSSAKRGTKFANLCNGGVCADVSSGASDGKPPNAPTINGAACDNSGHICTVHTLYDQSGNGTDLVQATGANQPTWVVSCSGLSASLPCLSGNSSSIGVTGTAVGSDTQPFTLVGAALTNSLACCSRIVSAYNGSTGAVLHFNGNVNLFCGSDVGLNTASTSVWYAAQGVCNGASSSGYVNGTSSGTISAGSASSNAAIGEMEDGSGGSGLNGNFVEAGLIPSDASGTFSSMNSNIRTFWGF